MCDQKVNSIVIDNGTRTCRAGFSDEEYPKVVFPSVVGRAKYRGLDSRESFVGQMAQDRRSCLSLKPPIEHGIVADWDDMEKIWNHAFSELNVHPEEHPILLIHSSSNLGENKAKMAEIMFETFKTPALYMEIEAPLSLFASGRITGMVLESGEGVTHTVPIYQGSVVEHAVFPFNLAGGSLTDYLMRILLERGYSFTTSAEREIVYDIKEKLSKVALDYETDSNSPEENYVLPDGQEISIGTERYQCPETLFQPSVLGLLNSGIHVSLYDSIMKCDVDLRRDLFSNIVLSGGTTMFPGMQKRLEKEITYLVFPGMRVKVIAPPDRPNTAWIGGSFIASLEDFPRKCISKQEYSECGKGVVHWKLN